MRVPVRILVVDADPIVLKMLGLMIRRWGLRPLLFRHGEEALAYLRSSPPPSLLLVDITRSATAGVEFAQRVRAHTIWKWIPLVLMGSPHNEAPIADAPVLIKPFSAEVLYALIETHCQD